MASLLNSTSILLASTANSSSLLYADRCAISASITHSPYFAALAAAEMITGLLAFSVNLFFLTIIGRVRVFHLNLRILLAHLSLNLLLFSLGHVIKICGYSYSIVNSRFCDFVVSVYECRLRDFPFVVFNINITYTLPAILIERLYSTIRHKVYDNSKPWLSILLIGGVWANTLYYALSGIAYSAYSAVAKIPICETFTALNSKLAQHIATQQCSTELVWLIFSACVYIFTRHKFNRIGINRAKHTLASRFQISQNVEINSVMIPTVLLHTACYLVNYTLVILIFIREDALSQQQRIWFLHMSYVWCLIYALAFPLVAFGRSPAMRKRLEGMRVVGKIYSLLDHRTGKLTKIQVLMNGNGGGNSMTRVTAKAHFDLLDKMWNENTMVNCAVEKY